MSPGDVLSWKNFTYDDGERSDKLLVVVGECQDGTRLMLKTTSKAKRWRPDQDGCHHQESVHRFKQYLAGFRRPTWIVFDPPIIRAVEKITEAGAHRIFSLKPNDLSAITNCYKKSPDISEALLRYLI